MKVFRFDKREQIKEVYLNGLKQIENEDYTIGKNSIKFIDSVKSKDIVTVTLEKNYKVKK